MITKANTTITEADAISGLKAAVEVRGRDYVDPRAEIGMGCRNVYENEGQTCRCIVGEALSQLGVPDMVLEGFGPAYAAQWALPITEGALVPLIEAQRKQDNGATWGEAYDAAVERVGEENLTAEQASQVRVTVDDALRGLTLAAKAYGAKHVDPRAAEHKPCQNVYECDGETVRCIAAEALSQLGVSDDALKLFNDLAVDRFMEDDSPVSLSSDAAAVLMMAQSTQDRRGTWGEAHQSGAYKHAQLTGLL